MARRPAPWYWKARKAWYVQMGGKQIRLGVDEKAARKEWHRLMAASGERLPRAATVSEACEAFIEAGSHRRKATTRMHVYKLEPFALAFKNRQLDSMTPVEVIHFVRDYRDNRDMKRRGKPLGETSRALMFRYIKTLFRWARDTGMIEVDPLARTESPWNVQARERPMSLEEYQAVMGKPRLNRRFKEVVEFVWRTGIRPGELAILSARHMDAHRPIARFQPTEHKTGTKTGLQREVYFPADLWERLKGYAQKYKEGPLLRNTKGRPWTQELISDCFHRVKLKLGLKCVLYQARHSFLTRLVEGGVPLARAAKIAGHSSTTQLTRTYYHPDTERMLEDVERASGSDRSAEPGA